MDRIEQRVRDSLQARASDVEPSQELWDEVDRRITRRQRWRVGAFALAGATAVAVGVLVVPGLLGGVTTPGIEPWSPSQEETDIETPPGPDEEPADVETPPGPDEEPAEEAEETEESVESVGPTGVAEPVVVIDQNALVLVTPEDTRTLVTLPEEGESWFLSVAVRPGSTVDDLTIVTTTTAEGFADLRWTRIVDGEVAVPFEAFEGIFTPSTANISRPMSPISSHTSSTSRYIGTISFSRLDTKSAIVVKCGALSAESAMNTTFSRHSAEISRLEVTPRA
jgi:hypothetical protein